MRDKKILTSKEWIPDINGKKVETTVTVYYDRRRDDFYVKCPNHLCEKWQGYSQTIKDGEIVSEVMDGEIHASRPQEAMDKFLVQCREYMFAIQEKRKIIGYILKTEEDVMFERGTGLIIEWHIGWEVKIGERVELFTYEPPDKLNVVLCNQSHLFGGNEDKRVRLMDWTEDREQFFRGLTEVIEGLKEKCKIFLGDEKKLALAIDTGQSPPLIDR
jgi:hypothetical protein